MWVTQEKYLQLNKIRVFHTSRLLFHICPQHFHTNHNIATLYQKNLALNPHFRVNTRKLHWTNTCGEENKFDIIFGCDITYDVNHFDAIFTTVKKCLLRNGLFYLCHDNDSCPIAGRCLQGLQDQAAALHMKMSDVYYHPYVGEAFSSDTVKMWKFEYI